MLDSCRSPPPGRSGHRGHVEPAGAAAAGAGPRGDARSLVLCPRRVPGNRCLRACRMRMPQAWGGTRLPPRLGVGFRTRHVSRVSQAAPAVPPPGSGASSSPGGCSLRGGLGLLHLPWVCRGSGLWLQLHLPLALSQRWHRALQLLWRSAQCWARVWRATVSCRQHCEPGQGQVAAEGDDQWCRAMPRVLCQEPAVPCSASGALGVSGPVQCPGATQCPRCGATAQAASVSQSKVQQLPPPHPLVPRPCSPDSLSQ